MTEVQYSRAQQRTIQAFERAEAKEDALGAAVFLGEQCPEIRDILKDLDRLKNNILFMFEAGVLVVSKVCRQAVIQYVKRVHDLHVWTAKAMYSCFAV